MDMNEEQLIRSLVEQMTKELMEKERIIQNMCQTMYGCVEREIKDHVKILALQSSLSNLDPQNDVPREPVSASDTMSRNNIPSVWKQKDREIMPNQQVRNYTVASCKMVNQANDDQQNINAEVKSLLDAERVRSMGLPSNESQETNEQSLELIRNSVENQGTQNEKIALNDALKELAEKQQTISQLVQVLETTDARIEQERQDTVTKEYKLFDKIAELEKQLNETKTTNHTLQQEVHDKMTQIKALRVAHEKANVEKNRNRAMLRDALKSTKHSQRDAKLEKMIETQSIVIRELRAENRELKRKQFEHEGHLDTIEALSSSTKQKEMQRVIDELMKERNEAKIQIKALQKDVDDAHRVAFKAEELLIQIENQSKGEHSKQRSTQFIDREKSPELLKILSENKLLQQEKKIALNCLKKVCKSPNSLKKVQDLVTRTNTRKSVTRSTRNTNQNTPRMKTISR